MVPAVDQARVGESVASPTCQGHAQNYVVVVAFACRLVGITAGGRHLGAELKHLGLQHGGQRQLGSDLQPARSCLVGTWVDKEGSSGCLDRIVEELYHLVQLGGRTWLLLQGA